MFNKAINITKGIILKFDLFSKPAEIGIGGNDSSRSIIGAILSIICITLTMILTKPSIQNFLYEQNPTVSSYIEYDTKEINMTTENFGFTMSFFSQMQNEKSEISNITNNYTDLIEVQEVSLTCNTCNFNINSTYYQNLYNGQSNVGRPSTRVMRTDGPKRDLQNALPLGWEKDRSYLSKELIPNYANRNISSNNFTLEYCKPSYFDGIRIRSVSEIKAFDISAIMKTFSLCLPSVFTTVLDDGSKSKFEDNMKAYSQYSKPVTIPQSLSSTFTKTGLLIHLLDQGLHQFTILITMILREVYNIKMLLL